MVLRINFICLVVFLLIISAQKKMQSNNPKEKFRNSNDRVYKQGMEEFEKGDVIYAEKNLVRLNFISPINMAPRAVLAYGFSQGYYNDAISLERFLVKYKSSSDRLYIIY